MTEVSNDHHLVHLLQKGDFAAFDSLFEVYSQKLFCLALKYFKNEKDAEERVQQVFVKVWETRQTLKSGLSFKAYLFTIALDQIRKHFSKKAVSLRYIESLQNEPELDRTHATQEDEYESALEQITLYHRTNASPSPGDLHKKQIGKQKFENNCRRAEYLCRNVDNQVSEALRFIRSRLNT